NQPGMQKLREKLLGSALEYYKDFVKQRHDDPLLRRELAEAYLRWGSILAVIGSRDEKGEAQEALRQAIALFERLEPDEQAGRGLARSWPTLAYVQIFANQPAEGGEMARRATDLLKKLWGEHPEVNEYGRLLGRSYDLIAASLGNQGRPAEVKP